MYSAQLDESHPLDLTYVFVAINLQFSKTVSLKFIIMLSFISCRSSKYRFSNRFPEYNSVGISQNIILIRQLTSLMSKALCSIAVAMKYSNLTLLTAVTTCSVAAVSSTVVFHARWLSYSSRNSFQLRNLLGG